MVIIRSVRRLTKTLPTSAQVAASCGCFLMICVAVPADARAENAVRCTYEARSDIAAALRAMRGGEEASRLAAATVLGQIGKDALPLLMAAIPETMRHNAESNAWPAEQRDFAIVLTDVIRAILAGDRQAILRFRQCTTDTIIKPLAWASRGDNARLRVNSANILANIVDNTTVCLVLHHLRDAKISTSGRANLLGVTNSMASYAYKENVVSIKDTINAVNGQIGSGAGFEQTRAIVTDITGRISKSENKDTSLQNTELKDYCAAYDFSGTPD